MATTLKMCLMIHLEDGNTWDEDVPGTGRKLRDQISTLAKAVGGETGNWDKAKISLQADLGFFDSNAGVMDYPLTGPTAIGSLLDYGGNLWCQCHSSTHAHLVSAWASVASAVDNETGGTVNAKAHVAGRSGGADVDDPTLDWVSITQATTLGMKLRMMDSSVVNYFATSPKTLIPYGLSADDLRRFYWHDAAPGPLNPGVNIETMRQRPFWVEGSSAWADNGDLSTFSPEAEFADTGSVLMIPQPVRWDFGAILAQRTTLDDEITPAGMRAMLTAVWTASEMATRFQSSITNVWYSPIRLNYLTDTNIGLIRDFVQSVYELMTVGGFARAEWHNMNEIGSIFSNASSKYNHPTT